MADLLVSLPDTDPKFFAELSKDPRKVQPLDPKLLRQQGVDSLDGPTNTTVVDLGHGAVEPPFPFIGNADENVPTADIIDHVLNGIHASDYRENDGYLLSVVTEAECIDNIDIPKDDDEVTVESDTASDPGSGSDYDEPGGDVPSGSSLLIPTVTQG
jgi:hypothetical protein